ncbi:MAG: anaerobic ribonucleoside-triphosphate reductase activating protein [Clostridia bacterium]|jgi:pyruvate formate lyase activating enzyme|nr:anaerobic ribonucleoside-triphosphate reductase activating protein [Clostridia bacterium]MDD4275902.1 anaerobic ribonucleoside-triphosphate reductase activating protein [Clostridia bacterium]
MIIGGYVKNSFVDYPQNISAVIFTVGCNMNCWYCHNKNLITMSEKIKGQQKKLKTEIFDFLRNHRCFLDAVVISGGEPTLQNDLFEFIIAIKSMGYKVKLDTNGTNPDCIHKLIKNKLVDYIAMDIKAPLNKYNTITETNNNLKDIEKSIKLIMDSLIDYEFRTTFAPPLTVDELVQIAQIITGANNYCIQKYRPCNDLDNITEILPIKSTMLQAQLKCCKFVKQCNLRGF